MSVAASGGSVTSTQKPTSDLARPSAKFRPDIWGDIFLQYDSESMEVNESMKQQMQTYKEEVNKIFLSYSTNSNISQKLNFIDLIQRLGISYHFEHEINEALEQIYYDFTNNNLNLTIEEEGGLQYLALLFRLLRQKGYQISSDIFNKFKNNNGKFNDMMVIHDVHGMWNLYEAAQLRIRGEDILDEALNFTCSNLQLITNQLSPSLAGQINQSLRRPLHMEVSRLQTRHYISFYEEDPSHNKVLLAFAKLDFNWLQKLHRKELVSNTKWWRKSEFMTKVPYTRDRVVESFMFSFFMSHEPRYSTSRIIVGKMVALVSVIDDTYDTYGTLEELELFTEAIKRWDINLIESLSDCIKVVFNAIVELLDEIELLIEGGKSSLVFQHIKHAFCELAHAYMVEAKWCHECYIPTYDEYKANGLVSTSISILIKTFICLGDFTTKEVFDWIVTDPPIINVTALHGRLKDDMGSHKFEQQRIHVASAVECCMRQYNISQEEAYKLIQKDIEDIWKYMNEAYLQLNVSKPVLDCVLSFARGVELIYEDYEDKYTNGELFKDYVAKLILDPIVV